ncbi:MAG TPA: hypothetical protein VEV43_02890 [Actinomycetota bacterium]|nr:hypothetical protein [Actinomycetota bacterium]
MRSTAPGLLGGLPGEPEAPAGALTREGGFSLVAGTADGRVKKLPSLYVNSIQVYAARDVSLVQAKLARAVDAFMASARVSTYMLTACEIGGRRGLFGTDFFNRSIYRQKLKRLGMTFSDDLYVMMSEDGTFYAQDRDPFVPEFVTLQKTSPPRPGADRVSGGFLVYLLSYYRIADIEAPELSRLVALAREIEALRANEPEDLVAALTGAASPA